jgi:hypothetical protein
MTKKTVISKKRRGPPATGKGTPVVVRLQPDRMAALDGWIAAQDDPRPSRPEAIRRLVELGLGGSRSAPGIAMVPLAAHPKPGRRGRASEMASQEIDKIGDPSATDEERHQRKRRLIKGPREFREMRSDLPKPKS